MDDMLLLTGSNGRTGRAILTRLAAAGVRVRAFIRDGGQAESLRKVGAAECVVGDLEQSDSFEAALRSVTKIVHVGPPMHPLEHAITSQLVDAAKRAGIGHFIYYSVMHPLSRAIRHHRLKLDAEEYLIASGVPHTIVQPSRYMQHLEPIWSTVTESGVHAMPFNVDVKFSVVDLEDVAEACAVIVGNPDFHYGTYELAGPEALSQADMAEIIGKVIGRPVEARALTIDEMRRRAVAGGASEDRLEQMEIMNRHYDAYGFRSNARILECILQRPATRFAAYVERVAKKRGVPA